MKSVFLFFIFFIDIFCKVEKIEFIPIKYNKDSGFFTIPISFGSNKEIFELQIDTTTSKSWIPSPKFPLDVKKYNISKSSTGIITKRSLELEDEDGTVFGKACYETIKIGLNEFKQFGFGLMNEIDYKFNDYPQGKLGLGYSQQNDVDFNIIKHFKKMGLIEKEEFMIDSRSNILLIGNISKHLKMRHGECHLLETNTLARIYRESWSCLLTFLFYDISYIKLNNHVVTSVNYEYIVETNGWALFDSAFNYISFPRKYFNNFINNFFKGYIDSCKIFKDLDWLYFKCYDKSFVDIAEIYFLINNEIYPLYSDRLFIETGNGEYELLIRFYKKEDNVFIFGNPFMKNLSISYDYEEKKISFYGVNSFTYEEALNHFQKKLDQENWETFKDLLILLLFGLIFAFVASLIKGCCKK